MKLIAIVAVDQNNAIGFNNDLLFKHPQDLKHFKETTEFETVVMGRKTFESMGSKPLKNRFNCILTKDETLLGSESPHSNNRLLFTDSKEHLIETAVIEDKNLFVIGGSDVYKLFENDIEEIIITVFNTKFENADTYFPIDLSKFQIKTFIKELDEHNGISASVYSYKREVKVLQPSSSETTSVRPLYKNMLNI